MALSGADKIWIQDEIQNALKRHGWGKLKGFIKDWGGAGAFVGIVIFLVTQWTAYTEFRVHTVDQLGNIEKRLNKLEAAPYIAVLKQSAENPTNPKSIQETKQALKEAKGTKARIPPEVVKETGAKFMEASQNNSDAWDATLSFLDYRSFLNQSTEPQLTHPLTLSDVEQHYFLTNFSNHKPRFSVYGHAPIAQAARLNLIGKAEPLEPYGHAYVLLEGDSVIIDDLEMKNVVFRNVHIIYLGGRFIMENVYFINCTFEIVRQTNGQNFARAVLNSNPVSAAELKPT
jgi:hypothetical protein